jgi:hypothetical protein
VSAGPGGLVNREECALQAVAGVPPAEARR